MSDKPIVIHWFRRDIRLSDNTALIAAAQSDAQVLPLFIFDPAILNGERFSPNRLAFLLNGLTEVDEAFRKLGGRLIIREGNPAEVLPKFAKEVGAIAVYANRDYTPYAIKRDKRVADAMREVGIEMRGADDFLIHQPGEVVKPSDDKPYTVYTPFRKRWDSLSKREPDTFKLKREHLASLDGIDAGHLPTLKALGHSVQIEIPDAGEAAAQKRLEDFVIEKIEDYAEARNELSSIDMSKPPLGTSFLSPYLRMGMLSPRQAYAAAKAARGEAKAGAPRHSVDVWIGELAWRDFYNHILFFFPYAYNSSYRKEYEKVKFRKSKADLERWQAGMTGYPVVDAAMRQLQQVGWMHNRARMIVSSFLTKDLLIYWRDGDVHFMHHLLDGDPASNNGGWQWAAGTGTDAQPYFRIFNPVSQSEKFDPNGDYIRHFVPELRDVDTKTIHTPWEMSTPPKKYPAPIVDHKEARERTLEAFKAARVSQSVETEQPG